jgi:ketosteroid isomerase-like protein
LSIAVFFLGCSDRPTVPKHLYARDVQVIEAIRSRFFAAISARDSSQVAQYLAAAVIVMPPDHPAIVGREAAADWLAKGLGGILQITKASIAVEQNLAVEKLGYRIVSPNDSGESGAQRAGKSIEIYHRVEGEDWKLVRMIWNEDAPSFDPR